MTAALTITKAEKERIEYVLARAAAALKDVRGEHLPANAATEPAATDAAGFARVQDRIAEETRGISAAPRVRALLSDPAFWNAAALLPDNNIHSERVWVGRPLHYPSWILFALLSMAAIPGIESLQSACTYLRDPAAWRAFADNADRYVPEGWTRVADIPLRGKRAWKREHDRRQGIDVPRAPYAVEADPPQPHHLDHFLTRWRAQPTLDDTGTLRPHPWAGIRRAVAAQFRADAMSLAQTLGCLVPGQPLYYERPDRQQAVSYDGTVFTFKNAPRATASSAPWQIGGTGPLITGSKLVFGSTRTHSHGTRVILDVAHSGTHTASDGSHESETIRLSLERLRPLAGGGIRIVISDSILRGEDVTDIQADGIIVVNYPHAQRNPGRKIKGKNPRHNDKRAEKSHLRMTIRHRDSHGDLCIHPIYAIGGGLYHVTETANGTYQPSPVTVTTVNQRKNKDGTSRWYLNVEVPCALTGTVTDRVALFHTDGPSDDPAANWGEYVRVWPTHSPQFGYLAGRRNDTETWHSTIKKSIKWMSHDAADQIGRALGAALTFNATARALNAQRLGMPNAIDDSLRFAVNGP